jgi:cytochrome c
VIAMLRAAPRTNSRNPGRNALAAALVLAAFWPLRATCEEALAPAAQRGLAPVRANCARCHAIDTTGRSPLVIAPPLRTVHERYPVEKLQKPLAAGTISTNHPSAAKFTFDAAQTADVIAYLKSLEQ